MLGRNTQDLSLMVVVKVSHIVWQTSREREWTAGRTNISSEEDLEEGCDEVVDALHIATRRMSDGPYVEYSF